MTLEQAKSLRYGQEIWAVGKDYKGYKAMRYRVTGKVQTWKRDPTRVRVPLKHGLYVYDAITEDNLGWWIFSEEEAKAKAFEAQHPTTRLI